MPKDSEPGTVDPAQSLSGRLPGTEVSAAPGRRRRNRSAIFIIVLAALLIGLGWMWAKKRSSPPPEAAASPGSRPAAAGFAVPVVPGLVEQKDVPIYLDGLGTVQAFNTVTVRTRADGQIQRIAYEEGQDVKAGDLLAQVD